MGQITVIRKNGTQTNLFTTDPFCAVTQAVQNFTLMGDDNVQLTIKSAEMMDFSIGDKIIVGGDEYSIRTKTNREILSEDVYSYDVVFYGVMYELMKSQYRDTDANGKSTKSTFDLTYSLADFIKVVIYNVNRDYPGIWLFDQSSCPDTEPKTMQFSKQNCLQVLQGVCKDFEYEFRISQNNGIRTIQVGKFGGIINPPGGKAFFEWGKGNGLYKLKEQKIDDRSIITRLWVEGGSNNIRSDYREYSDRLQLPLRRKNNNAHTLADGTVIPANSEDIGITNDANRYIEDVDLKNMMGSIEDTEYFDDIFPTRTGIVTALGTDIYSFVDNTMDFDLNEKDSDGNTKWLINEVSVKINFITGKLAGQQFELKKEGGYHHSTKTFTIIKYTDERGLEFPNEAFSICVGDKYRITDINLPDSYVNNAEEDLWYAGYEKFIDRKQARAQYVLTFDRMYFLNTMPDDSETSVFRVGDYVPVKDTRFNLEKNIRIQKLSRNLLVEHDYVLTLSDTTTISIQTQTVLDVLEHNVIIENNHLRDLNKARRSWRTTEDLRSMVYDTDGYFDSGNIRPSSIDTNMLTVGSKSQQFILIDVIFQANANGLPNRFDVSAGKLIHLTIENEFKTWNLSALSVTLSNNNGYYVFAKCGKESNTGVFYVTQQQLKFEDVSDPNNYYFQVGIIGALHTGDNFRDFVTTYGFTRINGNTITTGKITSSGGGNTYFDIDNGEIVGKITFRAGTTGYGNITDRPNLDEWANVITNNAQSIANAASAQAAAAALSQANANAATTVQGARNEIAGQLGYASYDALVTAATAGKTIINGGLLRTSLIDAEAIVTQTLVTKWITAAYISALAIETSKLTVKEGAKIGSFNINSYNGLTWNGYDYFGGTAFSLALGTNKMPTSTNMGSIIYARSNTATPTCCIAAIVEGFGCAIYGSTDGWGSNFPTTTTRFAGFFSGNVKTTGTSQAGIIAGGAFRYITQSYTTGEYSYIEGISFDPGTYDLDSVRFRVRGGLIVGVTNDNGSILQGT